MSKRQPAEPALAAAPAASPVEDTASDAAAADPARRHRGFHLRTEVGGGYRSFSSEAEGSTMEFAGAGAGFSLMLGGSLVENLVLVGELSVAAITNPTLTVDADSIATEDVTAAQIGFGPGVVYYVMPANVSLGASLLMTSLSLEQGDTKLAETDMGVGGVFRVGKDFWLTNRLGMGLGGQFGLSSMKDKGGGPTWIAKTLTVSASLTLN